MIIQANERLLTANPTTNFRPTTLPTGKVTAFLKVMKRAEERMSGMGSAKGILSRYDRRMDTYSYEIRFGPELLEFPGTNAILNLYYQVAVSGKAAGTLAELKSAFPYFTKCLKQVCNHNDGGKPFDQMWELVKQHFKGTT